jgi:flagellar biosynthesis protein FlhG
MYDQAETLRQLSAQTNVPPQSSPARVIAITSGKGGVGKTNLAVNVGLALARMGVRTGVLDADLGMGNVDIVLGVVPQFNLSHVIYGQKRMKDILVEGPESMKILAGCSGLYELANLSQWRLQRLTNALGELDDQLDILLIDTGAGISRNVLSFLLSVQEVIVITTNEPTSITDTYGLIKVLNQSNPNCKVSLVVNMVRNQREAEGVCRKLNMVVEKFLHTQLDYLGYMPFDDAVARSVQQQKPILQAYPYSPAARAIAQMAAAICERPRPTSGGIREIFARMVQLFSR